MKRVLSLAARGKGKTSPNPMVGAVDGRGENERWREKREERDEGTDATNDATYVRMKGDYIDYKDFLKCKEKKAGFFKSGGDREN